ncbi:hypothetical protein K280104A7_27660 [Candidatus Bariatricus faecipullorum]
MGIFKKRVNDFPTPWTFTKAVKEGAVETKLSMLLMGFGNIVHGQVIKGLIYLAVEVAYIVFMAVNGVHFLGMLGSLGTEPQREIWDEVIPKVGLSRSLIFQPVSMLISFKKFGITFPPF